MSEPLPLDLPTTHARPATTATGALLVAELLVSGTPAPQGSKHARPIYRGSGTERQFTGKVVVVEQLKPRLTTWRTDVKETAEAFLANLDPVRRKDFPLDAPLRVGIQFVLTRPQGHYGSGANSRLVRPSAPRWPAVTPDLDKLARSTSDALTASGIYRDDSRICELLLAKAYTQTGVPGARIQIWRLDT